MTERGDEPADGAPAPSWLKKQFHERPVAAWGGVAVLTGVIAAVIVIVAVGGGSEPANVAIKCSVSDSDGSVVMTLHGKVTQKESDEGCDGVAGELSGEGRYWRVGLPPTPDNAPEVVCAFNAPSGQSGTVLIEYNPESLASVATSLCGQLAHEGWTQQTQGGVMGPWQRQYQVAVETQEAAEVAEREILEEERLEREGREEAVRHCEEEAQAEEEAELEVNQRETEEQVANAGGESEEFRLEEEGWEREEEIWGRGEEAAEECSGQIEAAIEDGVYEPEGGAEFR